MWDFVVKIEEWLQFSSDLSNQRFCVLCAGRSHFFTPPLSPRVAYAPTAFPLSACSLGHGDALLQPEALALDPHKFTRLLSLSGKKWTNSFTCAKFQLSEHLHSMTKHTTSHHSLHSGETESQQLNLQRQHNRDAQLQAILTCTARSSTDCWLQLMQRKGSNASKPEGCK